MRGEGREWPARVRSGGGPSRRRRRPPASNSLRREFEGNSGIPFEGNSKGTRTMLKVLCVVSSKFCKFTYRYRESVAGAVARSPRRISKKAMEGDECIFVGAQASHGVPLTTQGVLRIARRASAARTRRLRGRSRVRRGCLQS